jgi:hypothetical protein
MTFQEQHDAMFAEMDLDEICAFFNENLKLGDIGPQADPDVEGYRRGHLARAGAAANEMQTRMGGHEAWEANLRDNGIPKYQRKRIGLLMGLAEDMADVVAEPVGAIQ